MSLWPSRRAWRIALAFLLTPGVLVAILLASAVSEGWQQNGVLLAATLCFVLGVSAVALPTDAQDDYVALKQLIRRRRTITALLAVPAVFAAAWIARAIAPGDSWAGVAVQAGLALWVFAVLAYQSRRIVPRGGRFGSVLVGVLDALLVLAAPFVWVVLFDVSLLWWQALFALVGLPALLFAGMVVVSHLARPPGDSPPPPGKLAVAGVFFAIVSGALLLGSAIRVPIERRLLETSQVAERGAVLPAMKLRRPGALTPEERRAVLERYAPVLRLHEREPWIAYDAAVALAAIRPAPPEDCAERAKHPCAEVPLETVSETLPGRSPPTRMRVFDEGVVYPRLLWFNEEDLGDEVPEFARRTRWLAQYWLFYPHNRWQALTAVGTFVQEHGGDWEWVGVGLDAQAAPVFVAYSAHCAGSWRPWREAASVAVVGTRVEDGGEGRRVLVGGTARAPASRPLAIVALGSHANYATPGTREPDWAGCKEWGAFWVRAVKWLTFAVAAREETPDLGPFQVPTVLDERDTRLEAQRRLWWGSEGHEQLWRIRLGAGEHGPESPVYHEAWRDPLHTVFGTDWECDAGDACPDA